MIILMHFFLLEEQAFTAFIPLIALLCVCIIYLVGLPLYHQLTAKEELDIEGTFVDISDKELPIVPFFHTFAGDFSSPTIVTMPFGYGDNGVYMVHEYELNLEDSKGKKYAIKIDRDFVKKIKDHVERAGKHITVHCVKFLWNRKFRMEYIVRPT